MQFQLSLLPVLSFYFDAEVCTVSMPFFLVRIAGTPPSTATEFDNSLEAFSRAVYLFIS